MEADFERLFAASAFEEERYERLDLSGADFAGKELAGCTFVGCKLPDTTRAVFEDCDLAQTQIERCDLTSCDFTTSRGVFFDVAKNKVKGARIAVETAALMAAASGLVVQGYGEPTRTKR